MTDDLPARLRLVAPHGSICPDGTPEGGWRPINPDGEEADDRIEAQARRIEGLEAALKGIFAKLDDPPGAPGHRHTIPGIWDNDVSNGEKAGKPCDWCAHWEQARAALTPSMEDMNDGRE